MSENFRALSARIVEVGEVYARRFGIERTPDWYLLKLAEELGELTAEHVEFAGGARPSGRSRDEIRRALEDEAADLFGQFVLYLDANGIDIEQAIARKWLGHLDEGTPD